MKDEKNGSWSEMAQNAEAKLTESLLRWRYKKQGKTLPSDEQLKSRSQTVTGQVNEILLRRGKNLWKEIKSKTEKED
jgi:hypothetical protein